MQNLVDILINTIIMTLFSDPDTLEVIHQTAASEGNLWKYISIVQFGIIAYLAYKLYRNKPKIEFKNKPKTEFKNIKRETVKEAASKELDMENVVNSINKAKPLFKLLSKKCHPDKFAKSEKHEIALIVYQKITDNKRNYSKLLELKEIAEEELDIKIAE